MNFENELQKLFNDAIGVTDTIWYSKSQTLFEAILELHEKEKKENYIFLMKCDDDGN